MFVASTLDVAEMAHSSVVDRHNLLQTSEVNKSLKTNQCNKVGRN